MKNPRTRTHIIIIIIITTFFNKMPTKSSKYTIGKMSVDKLKIMSDFK